MTIYYFVTKHIIMVTSCVVTKLIVMAPSCVVTKLIVMTKYYFVTKHIVMLTSYFVTKLIVTATYCVVTKIIVMPTFCIVTFLFRTYPCSLQMIKSLKHDTISCTLLRFLNHIIPAKLQHTGKIRMFVVTDRRTFTTGIT